MTHRHSLLRHTLGFVLLLSSAASLAAPGPAAMPSMHPGLWRWTIREDGSTIGTRAYSISQCMRPESWGAAIMRLSGSARACASGETAARQPDGSLMFRFSCTQAAGPVHTHSRGHYHVVVAHGGSSARLNGRVVTYVSGLAFGPIVTSVHGSGSWVGSCH